MKAFRIKFIDGGVVPALSMFPASADDVVAAMHFLKESQQKVEVSIEDYVPTAAPQC